MSDLGPFGPSCFFLATLYNSLLCHMSIITVLMLEFLVTVLSDVAGMTHYVFCVVPLRSVRIVCIRP